MPGIMVNQNMNISPQYQYFMKMKRNCIAIVAMIVGVLASWSAPYALNIKDFTDLKVVDGINVVHKCVADSAGWVVFDAEETIASKILFSNDKNTLKIELATDGQPVSNIPTVYVYSRFLSKVENSGDSTVTVLSPTPSASIKFRIIGNGKLVAKNIHSTHAEGKIDTGRGHLVMTGKVQNVKLSNTGTGRIEASDLQAAVGKCSLLGTGPIDCAISEELTVVGLGSGTVYLKGKPKVKNRTIGVKVHAVE